MTFQEIDARRKAKGIPAPVLCERAGIDYSTYHRGMRSTRQPRAATLAKLAAALDRDCLPTPARSTDAALILATYRGWAAWFAAQTGIDAAGALASDPRLRANASPQWRRAAQVRELAVYCTVTELDLGGARVARAIGVTRAAVSLMLRRVEDARDDPSVDAMVEAAARLISGRKE
jgi:transcriptional regulator with XRE-family HTH domain